MNGSVTLDDLRAAYRRTSSRIYRILEDGYDFSVENLIIEILTLMALPGQDNAVLRQDIVNWSKIRNDAAHGGQLTSGYAIAAIFERAYQLEALLTDQMVRLDSEGNEAG